MPRTNKRALERAKADRALRDALRRSGYTKAKRDGHKATPVPFPDLSCEREGCPPIGNNIKNGLGCLPPKRHTTQVPDGFHVGHSHKQGLAVHSNADRNYTGGRKT